MTTRKKRTDIILTLVLLIFALILINVFVGNPVSKKLSARSAQEYVNQYYSDINLVLEKTVYNFKDSAYYSFFQSPESQDTAFSVYTDSFGHIIHDDYEHEVANNFTTYRRLDLQLREIGNRLMTKHLPYKITHAILLSADPSEQDIKNNLTKDMSLDIHHPPFGIEASIEIEDDDLSYEKMAEVMRSMEKLFDKENIPVSRYSIFICPTSEKKKDSRAKRFGAYNIPAELLSKPNLTQSLKEFDESLTAVKNIS